MVAPLVGAYLGFQAVNGLLAHRSASKAAKRQQQFQKAQIKSLGESARVQESTLAINELRSQNQIAQERLEASQEARRLRASSLVEQIESGQAGPSARRVIDDIVRQELNIEGAFDRKAQSQSVASGARLRGLRAETLSRQNQILSPINSPNLLSTALGIGSDIAQTLVFTSGTNAKAAG